MTYEACLESEDKVLSLFQPDVLLADQYLQTFRRKTYFEPEKRLMLAVLEDAVFCFQKYSVASHGRGKILFQNAEEWILEEESDCFFSFENMCGVLGIDAAYLREGLLHWKERKLAQHREQAKAKKPSLGQIRFFTKQRKAGILTVGQHQ